jgi:hypothetical protein
MISPQTFVNKIWDLPSDKIVELPEELQKSLEADGKTELEAIALAEKMLPRVRALLSEKIQNYERKRVTPNFRFSDSSNNRLVGILISEKEEQIRLKFKHRKELSSLINNLKWEKFESLCACTLQLCGFEKYQVGKGTKDGGLDFFGLYPLQSLVKYKGFLTDMRLRVFGQAKHRSRASVTGDEVRSFYTHYKDFLDEKGTAYTYVSQNWPWFLEAKGPLAPMIITNRRFEKGAEEFADRKGIIIREGSQIVEDIIQLSKIETWLTLEREKYIFAPNKFESYLDSMGGSNS